jgi:membrane fusion protein (multidrug efflux system)
MDETQTQAAKTPAGAGAEVPAPAANRASIWRRRPVVVVGTILLGGVFYLGLRYLGWSLTHESTDDAFIAANVVSMAPRVAGQVARVCVNDNQPVKAGDLLLEIDPRDYQVQVEQKKQALVASQTNVKLLQASIEWLGTQVVTAEATAKQSDAEAAADRAVADKASADLKRAEDLIRQKTISPQEYDTFKAAAVSANATLKAGEEKAISDRSKIAETRAELEAGRRAWERAQAQARQSQVDVDQAELNLSYTRVTAPQAGRVTRKAVEAGDYVAVGQRLLALVPDEIWVTANFKETQLHRIRPGLPVTIEVDSVSGRAFSGHVDSIQAGSGAAFSLLPPENAVGNYVKVVQRVPVKILFDGRVDSGHVLGPGMSVVPYVHVMRLEIPDVLTALAAGLLALGMGALWWRKANGKKPTA